MSPANDAIRVVTNELENDMKLLLLVVLMLVSYPAW